MYIRDSIVSRFPGGCVMEADYSQLEVIALAYLSSDRQLQKDILDGIDLHCMSAQFLTGVPYTTIKAAVDAGDAHWIKTRKEAKGPSFQLQYGAGYKSIAAQCGLSEELAKEFIQSYYKRYSGVKAWQDSVREEVQKSRVSTDRKTRAGFPIGKGTYVSVTGRRYTFYEYDAPSWTEFRTSFSPTEIKNYPVQGFATGDIVPLMLGHLLEVLNYREDLLLINTVHDSILFDCAYRYNTVEAHNIALMIKGEMQRAPDLIKQTFGINFNLPLSAEVQWGPTWGTMREKV